MNKEEILKKLEENEKEDFGFYAVINDKEIKTLSEYNNYMKAQFYIDNQKLLEKKCKEMVKELNNNLINNLKILDKSIEIKITIDKCGYIIETHKETYEE